MQVKSSLFWLPFGRLKLLWQAANDFIRLDTNMDRPLNDCPHVLAASVLKRVVRDSVFLVGFKRVPVGVL